MPDDHSQEEEEIKKTERYYINKRVDSIEVTVREGFQDIHDSIKDVHVAIKESNELTLALFKDCKKNCSGEVAVLKDDVKSLIGYRNRAIGAVGIILLLIGIWRVA